MKAVRQAWNTVGTHRAGEDKFQELKKYRTFWVYMANLHPKEHLVLGTSPPQDAGITIF